MIARLRITAKLWLANWLLRGANRLGLPPTPVGLAARDIRCGEFVRQGDILVQGGVWFADYPVPVPDPDEVVGYVLSTDEDGTEVLLVSPTADDAPPAPLVADPSWIDRLR